MSEIRKIDAWEVDGAAFFSIEAAEDRQRMVKAANRIGQGIPPVPGESDFRSGNGFVQHSEQEFKEFKSAILGEMAERCSLIRERLEKGEDLASAHPSWVDRLYESTDPLSRLWYRVSCTDSEFREWGQPFFRDNEGRSKRYVCLNPEASP